MLVRSASCLSTSVFRVRCSRHPGRDRPEAQADVDVIDAGVGDELVQKPHQCAE